MCTGKTLRKRRCSWKRLHLAVDADTGMISASTLTAIGVGNPPQVAPLPEQIEATTSSATADGSYHGMTAYDVVAQCNEDTRVIISPHVIAVVSAESEQPITVRPAYSCDCRPRKSGLAKRD